MPGLKASPVILALLSSKCRQDTHQGTTYTYAYAVHVPYGAPGASHGPILAQLAGSAPLLAGTGRKGSINHRSAASIGGEGLVRPGPAV